jgi:hypothetical protein
MRLAKAGKLDRLGKGPDRVEANPEYDFPFFLKKMSMTFLF